MRIVCNTCNKTMFGEITGKKIYFSTTLGSHSFFLLQPKERFNNVTINEQCHCENGYGTITGE